MVVKMDIRFLNKLKEDPDYEKTLEDIIEDRFDKGIMEKAVQKAQRASQVEALYVLLKLRG